MGLHYVLEQDALSIIAEDKDVKIVYKSINIENAFDIADLMNQYN
jgi:hypothetical protein